MADRNLQGTPQARRLIQPQSRPALLWFLPAAGVAKLLLWAAIVTIRILQWLYNRRLVRRESTDGFFRVSKRLERQALRIMDAVPPSR